METVYELTAENGSKTTVDDCSMRALEHRLKSMGVRRVHARNIRRVGMSDAAALAFAAKSADELCRKFPFRANGAIDLPR